MSSAAIGNDYRGSTGLEIGYIRPPKLTREEMAEVMAPRWDIPLTHFGISVVLVFVPAVLMYVYPTAWMAVICVLLNMHTFNRFAQLVHAADHSGMFPDKRWDEVAGRISGYFLGYSQEGHKEAHDAHHVFLNTDQDADRVWCDPEAPVSALFRGWVRDFFLISALRRFLQYVPSRKDRVSASAEQANGGLWRVIKLFTPIAFVQLTVLAEYALLPGTQYYFLFYVLPLFVLYPAQIRLRSTVEHSFAPGYTCPTPKDRRIIRSVRANPVERFLIAPLGIEYHYEHHVLAAMPYYNAPKLRKLLAEKGFAVPTADGYFGFIWNKWRAERTLSAQLQAS